DLPTIATPAPGMRHISQLSSATECRGFPYRNPLLATGPTSHICTTEVAFDTPKHIINFCLLEPVIGRLHGHVNWVPATYIGKLTFLRVNDNACPQHDEVLETFSTDGDIDLHLAELSTAEIRSRLGSF